MTQEALKKMYQLLLTEPHAETVCFKLEAIAREALAQPPLPVQEPVALHDAWSLREVYFDEDGEPSMHRSPPQRQWVGLTDEEVQFCALKHRQLVNAYYDAAKDTNVITAAFEATVFYKEIEAVLKERNHD